jgi:hypothetical protein
LSSIADEVSEANKCGPEREGTLVKIIKKQFWETTGIDIIKDKQSNYPTRTKNYEALAVPQINPEIKHKLLKELKCFPLGLLSYVCAQMRHCLLETGIHIDETMAGGMVHSLLLVLGQAV